MFSFKFNLTLLSILFGAFGIVAYLHNHNTTFGTFIGIAVIIQIYLGWFCSSAKKLIH
jgi:hypothetical protein